MNNYIKNIKKGDADAFNILVKENLTMVLNFVYRFVYDTEMAEDITQEVFIKV
jgi:DNA-directed RNA polymerase specialized sigma24 family protein